MEVWTGFILGFFGSLHCIGMCGPIVLALPSSGKGFSFVYGRVLYNLGRVVTYALLGLVFGLLGSKIYMFGLQQVASIALGAVIILWIAIPAVLKNKIRSVSGFNLFTARLKSLFMPLFKKRSNVSMILIGILLSDVLDRNTKWFSSMRICLYGNSRRNGNFNCRSR